jgi:hypothetical protein
MKQKKGYITGEDNIKLQRWLKKNKLGFSTWLRESIRALK